jgi:plastocyanin
MTLVAAAILLAACGGNGNGAGDGGDGGGGAATLSMMDNAFQPTSLTVSAGAELQVTNDGQALHNLTIEGTDVNQDVEAGQSSTVSVDIDAGDYTMFCEYHRSLGMEGTVTVQ